MMQLMAMMYSGQERQRVQNEWVVRSVEAISSSSGCAIEAPPASQDLVELPPALVRMTQATPQGTAIVGSKSSDTAAAAPAVAAPAVTADADPSGGASPARRKRSGKSAATGTPAVSAKAVGPPARAAKQLPNGLWDAACGGGNGRQRRGVRTLL